MSVKGTILSKWMPSILSEIISFFSSHDIWEVVFKCGKCNCISTVEKSDKYNYHKCPACGEINILE